MLTLIDRQTGKKTLHVPSNSSVAREHCVGARNVILNEARRQIYDDTQIKENGGIFQLDCGNDELEEIDYKDVKEEKFTREASTGYLVIGDKYWMTSILPPQGRKFRFDLDYKINKDLAILILMVMKLVLTQQYNIKLSH